MEVSSHALVLGRADAITFAVSAFTNLGRDHLDFHGDEESYFAAKAALFTPDRTRHAVINIDDPRGRVLAEQIRRGRGGQPDHGQPVRTGGLPGAGVRGGPGRSQRRPGRGVRTAGGVQPRPARRLQRPERADRAGHDRRGRRRPAGGGRRPGRGVGAGSAAAGAARARRRRSSTSTSRTPRRPWPPRCRRSGPGRRIAVLGCGGDRDPQKRGPMGDVRRTERRSGRGHRRQPPIGVAGGDPVGGAGRRSSERSARTG